MLVGDLISVTVVFQSNVGHRLLVKKGWKAGQGLGKQNQGNHHWIETCQKYSDILLGDMCLTVSVTILNVGFKSVIISLGF